MLHYKVGNLLDAPQNIIAHQVNCRGKMGSGVAKAIRDRYPHIFPIYESFSKRKDCAGKCQLIEITDTNQVIANLFSQVDYGHDGRRYTDYCLLSMALKQLFDSAATWQVDIAIPYKLGCDRGGGNWDFVEQLFEDFSKYYNVNVYIYSLEGY